MDKMEIPEIPMEAVGERKTAPLLNMNDVVGTCDIVFLCLDTLRYDVAKEEEENGGTPNLNRYGAWEKCHAPGNFTYPSHHAMFAGFLPSPAKPTPLMERDILFFPKNIGMGKHAPKGSYAFEGATFVEGLAQAGYQTMCVGGVAFFDKRSDIGSVFPAMFQKSYWNPSFGCTVKESFEHQIGWVEKKTAEIKREQPIFLYLNASAIHYPNYFYLDGGKQDSKESHAAALRYVDSQVERLFDVFRCRRKTFVIVCSDHGTCYGEDGYYFHNVSHESVYTVPYKHFFLPEKSGLLTKSGED